MFRDKYNWRVTWRDAGKRYYKSFTNQNDARLFEAQIKSGFTTALKLEQTALTFSEYARRWIEDYSKIEKSESTWENDETAIRLHIEPVIGHHKLIDLKKVHGLALKTALAKKAIKPKTVNNILQVAKRILAVAADHDLIPANPFHGIKPMKVPEPAFRFWTFDQRDQFLKRAHELKPEFAELVLVATHTGLRKGELGSLTRADIDFENGLIRVKDTYNSRLNKVLDRTKNLRVEYVPMNAEVLRVMMTRKLMKPKQLIFRRTLIVNNRRNLKTLCEKASVPFMNIHALRHTFASTMAMAGADPMMIQKLMRHKSFQMTQRYAHLHPDMIKGATDLISRDSPMTRSFPKIVTAKKVSELSG